MTFAQSVTLAERLVAMVLRSNHPDNDGQELDISGCVEWIRYSAEVGSVPDLDHPSNEGHLRRLAEEVLGRPVGVKFIRGGCRVEIINPSPDAWKTVHPTPGQAYAAAIVAHYEGEKA